VFAKTADFKGKPTFFNDIEIDGLGNVYVSDAGYESAWLGSDSD